VVVEKMVVGVDDFDGNFPFDDIDGLIVMVMAEYESASAYTIYQHLVEGEGKDIRRSALLNRLDRTRRTPQYIIKLYSKK